MTVLGSSLEISEVRRQFGSLAEMVRVDRVIVVTRHGRAAFAVVDVQFLDSVLGAIELLADREALLDLYRQLTIR